MRLEKKNIHMNKIVKSETVIFFVSREERIMDADNEIENIINQKEIVTTDGVVTRENQITVNGTIFCIIQRTRKWFVARKRK